MWLHICMTGSMMASRCDVTSVQAAQVACRPTNFCLFLLSPVPYFIYFGQAGSWRSLCIWDIYDLPCPLSRSWETKQGSLIFYAKLKNAFSTKIRCKLKARRNGISRIVILRRLAQTHPPRHDVTPKDILKVENSCDVMNLVNYFVNHPQQEHFTTHRLVKCGPYDKFKSSKYFCESVANLIIALRL